MKTISENKEYMFDSSDQMMIYEAVQYYIKATSNSDKMELDMMKVLNKILANHTFGDGEKYREALENGELVMVVGPKDIYHRPHRKYKWHSDSKHGAVVSKKEVSKVGVCMWH
tara:strand:- start:163 stop:501 length:339 start_codon:yes stop_codon:yes gene_type:complete